MARELSDRQFARLLEFRVALRRFNQWSEQQAATVGLTHPQHQVLVAVRGHADPAGPTITDLANYLLIRHHSAIGLLSRVEALGLVERHPDPDDQRVVRIRLTPVGDEHVSALTSAHFEELRRLSAILDALVD
jgi:DNA-binding MarR family transcriptional regulator